MRACVRVRMRTRTRATSAVAWLAVLLCAEKNRLFIVFRKMRHWHMSADAGAGDVLKHP